MIIKLHGGSGKVERSKVGSGKTNQRKILVEKTQRINFIVSKNEIKHEIEKKRIWEKDGGEKTSKRKDDPTSKKKIKWKTLI